MVSLFYCSVIKKIKNLKVDIKISMKLKFCPFEENIACRYEPVCRDIISSTSWTLSLSHNYRNVNILSKQQSQNKKNNEKIKYSNIKYGF